MVRWRNPNDMLGWRDLYQLCEVAVRAHDGRGRSYRTHDEQALRLLAEVVTSRGGHVGSLVEFGDDLVLAAHLADALGFGDGRLDGRWVRIKPPEIAWWNEGTPWWWPDGPVQFWSNEDEAWVGDRTRATVFERPDLRGCSTTDGQWRYLEEVS